MESIAGVFTKEKTLRYKPVNGETHPKQNSDVTHNGTGEADMAVRREHDHDDELSEIVAREIRIAMRDQIGATSSLATRSVDTLRRDIGIFAILLGMMVQTGAAFYWAGGVSRSQDAAKEVTKQIQDEQAYTRAQLQLIDGKLQKIEGREVERERQQMNGNGHTK